MSSFTKDRANLRSFIQQRDGDRRITIWSASQPPATFEHRNGRLDIIEIDDDLIEMLFR